MSALRSRRVVRCASALAAGFLLAACTSAPPANPQQVRAQREEFDRKAQRLLDPLLVGGNLACGELVIEISPNFFPNVARPAIDPNMQGERKSSGDGYDEYVWINKVGGLDGAIVLTIGATDEITEQGFVAGKGTKFTVLQQATLRVRTAGSIAAQLDVTATGKPMVWAVQKTIRDLTAFELRNGLLHTQ